MASGQEVKEIYSNDWNSLALFVMELNFLKINVCRLLDVNNPRQTNRAYCGIFVMIYAELLSDGHLRMFSFDQEDM